MQKSSSLNRGATLLFFTKAAPRWSSFTSTLGAAVVIPYGAAVGCVSSSYPSWTPFRKAPMLAPSEFMTCGKRPPNNNSMTNRTINNSQCPIPNMEKREFMILSLL